MRAVSTAISINSIFRVGVVDFHKPIQAVIFIYNLFVVLAQDAAALAHEV